MTLNISGTLAILVITWLIVQAIKPTKINNHLLPIVSVVVGAIVALVISYYTKDTRLVQDVVVGAFTGFGATGVNETITKSISAIIDGFSKSFIYNSSSDEKSEDSVEESDADASSVETNPSVEPAKDSAQ